MFAVAYDENGDVCEIKMDKKLVVQKHGETVDFRPDFTEDYKTVRFFAWHYMRPLMVVKDWKRL